VKRSYNELKAKIKGSYGVHKMKLIIKKLFDKILCARKSLLIFIVVLQTSILSFLSPDPLLGFVALFSVVYIIWSRLGALLANKLTPLREMKKDVVYNNRILSDGLAFLVAPLPFLFWIYWPIAAAFTIAISLASVPLAFKQLRAIIFNQHISREAERRYLEIAPRIVLYISGPANVAYQVNQWLPILETLPAKTIICIRSIKIFEEIKPTKLPVFYVLGAKQHEWLFSNGPQIVLYPNNRALNSGVLRFPHLKHIHINHGESDKFSNQSKMLLAYDYLFVGGNLTKKRLVEAGLSLRKGQLIPVGRPQAEILLTNEDQTGKPVRNILYAPTWEGGIEATDYTSVCPFGVEMLELLAKHNDLQIKLKPHPMTGSQSTHARTAMQQMLKVTKLVPNIELIDQSENIFDAMNWSDMMICDVSAVLADYLVTGKPIALCAHFARGRPPAKLAAEFPLSEATYLIETPGDIVDVLTTVTNGDPRNKDRKRIRQEAIGEPGAVERFERKLLDILDVEVPNSKD
jgi:Icc-related predicted phosphoesterase